MRTLFLDIETSPMEIKTWGVWEQNALKIDEEWRVLCASYAWGDGPVKVIAPTDTSNWKDRRHECEAEVLAVLWDLLDDADIVIAHNGDKFDIKKINARLVQHGYGPPSPYRTVDTLKAARKHFALTKNRLDYVGHALGVGGKTPHTGVKLWFDCVDGDPKAWKLMKKYAKQDTVLLRDVYNVILPWISNHPHTGGDGCPKCGSTDAQKRGIRYTNAGIGKQQYQCNTCGGYYISGKPISNPATRN